METRQLACSGSAVKVGCHDVTSCAFVYLHLAAVFLEFLNILYHPFYSTSFTVLVLRLEISLPQLSKRDVFLEHGVIRLCVLAVFTETVFKAGM